MENIFRVIIFLYSPCPNLEGIKDAFRHKFKRLTIGQNCSAVCTNKGDHRNAFSNKQRKAPWVLRGLLSRPLSLEQRERQGLFFAIPVNSLAVDSVFEQSENVTIAHFFLVSSSSSYCWPAVRGLAYTIIGSKLVALSYAHAHCTNRRAAWRPGSFSLSILLIAHISHIISWLWHQAYLKLP